MQVAGMKRVERSLLWFFALAAVVVVGWFVVNAFAAAHAVAEQSAQAALMDEAVRLLDAYHKQHGEYPGSLESFEWTYPDGGDASTLATMRYESDGETYTLKAEAALGGEIVTGSELGGRITFR